MKNILLALVICLAPLTGMAADPAGGSDRPLLIPGKQSLYQRVLSVPGARISTEPGVQGHAELVPFTALYVYARLEKGGKEWVEVGMDRFGSRSGWLLATDSIEWNNGLTAAFRDPEGHDRVLLFKDSDSLRQLAGQRDLQAYRRVYREALQGDLPPDSPVVAIQPPGFIDVQEDFYLVPIHRYEDIYLGNEKARLLQVSSVPLRGATADAGKTGGARRGYTAGLVFVIDSTLSMQPYIDRTRQAVKTIFDTLGKADLLGQVNFGLVAFRDNVAAAPGLDYLVRTYVDLDDGGDADSFLSRLRSLRDASVSSRDFTEDAYAGVKQAIDKVNWAGHDARYIVLVTDAGAREADDPLSSTGLGAEALRQMAQEKGIAIFVLHLLTDATMANHAADAEQYRQLADFPGVGSLYYGVQTGNVQEFGRVLDALAGQITGQVRMASSNKAPAAPVPPPGDNDQLAELQAKVAKLGYALRMRYLQKTDGGQVPNVFDAWLLDRDISNPARHTLDVRVLLTRDQLSDLNDVLTQVLGAAEEGLLSPQNFLGELQSLAATATRDPEQLGTTTNTTAGAGSSLAEMGYMREYIEDLPYSGEVMGLSLDDWQSWSTQQQIAFLHRLEEKVSYYRALHDHTDLWVSLDGGPVSGDSVYPIELEMLP
jgi:hypothetical protein